MGLGDYVGLQDLILPGSTFLQNKVIPKVQDTLGFGASPQQPGVAQGPAPTDGSLVRDPVTGQYVDPRTGTRYAPGPNGEPPNVVNNPNVATQVANANAVGQSIVSALPVAQQHQQTAFGGQQRLVGSYQDVVNGTAPSVAQNQLTGSLNTINRGVLSQASGAGGQNGFAARRQAMQVIGNNSIDAAGKGAIARAAEVDAARTGQAGVLNSIAAGANTQAGQAIQGGLGYSELAQKGQLAQQGLNQAATDKSQENKKDFYTKGLTALSTFV